MIHVNTNVLRVAVLASSGMKQANMSLYGSWCSFENSWGLHPTKYDCTEATSNASEQLLKSLWYITFQIIII